MPKTKKSKTIRIKTAPERPLRFADPFFTTTPIDARAAIPGVGKEMTDYVQTKLLPIPPVRGDARFSLDDVIGAEGAAAIAQAYYQSYGMEIAPPHAPFFGGLGIQSRMRHLGITEGMKTYPGQDHGCVYNSTNLPTSLQYISGVLFTGL